MIIGTLFALVSVGSITALEENCGPDKFSECIAPMYNASVGHYHGLFQNVGDLYETCPILRNGVTCLRDYAKSCNTEMVAEDFNDQFEKPMKLIEEICNEDSPLRAEYLQHSPCMLENSEEFSACGPKIHEFLSTLEAKTDQEEKTATCMYEMMARACFLSTAANSCGLGAAEFIRKALQHTPSSGLNYCFAEQSSTDS